MTVLGIIGGSGLYDIDGLEDRQTLTVESPFGDPSDDLQIGTLDGLKLVFLPRHGRGHALSPTDINYRANIDVLKRAGVTDILSLSACGSLREEMSPGDFVLVDQFIDRTFAREKSFFGSGCVAHVAMAQPTCGFLGLCVEEALKNVDVTLHSGGTYLAMEGPQFSTRAESELYRSWGCDVIGMTNMPEAKLAREAEICYSPLAMVTDYDCWHTDHTDVDIEQIIRILSGNTVKARDLIRIIAPLLKGKEDRHPCAQKCDHALDVAIITAPQSRDPAMLARLDAVAGRVL